MGKWTDKNYITHSEWNTLYGGAKAAHESERKASSSQAFRRLPYDCCMLSLKPFKVPVMSAGGLIFDQDSLLSYFKSNKRVMDVGTGEALFSIHDFFPIYFHKNQKGEYHCPVTMKVFNDHSHIVVIRPSGNVYSYEAIQKLCLDRKHFHDLLNENVSFTKKDICTIQDPTNLSIRNINNLLRLKYEDNEVTKEDKSNPYVKGGTVKQILKKLKEKEEKICQESKKFGIGSSNLAFHNKMIENPNDTASISLPNVSSQMSQGKVAASATSTSMTPVTRNNLMMLNEEEKLIKSVKENAYLSMTTNLGLLNIELWTPKAPKTVYNFLSLAKSGYYNDTIFHRNISNFMIQGGDPTGTGKGGQSVWKRVFEDEFSDAKHDQRGIMSMANHGKDTNQSQFFITYKPCPHLDKKHTVFGRVVGGLSTLDAMERAPSDSNNHDRPMNDVIISNIQIIVDPFEEHKGNQKTKKGEATKKTEEAPLTYLESSSFSQGKKQLPPVYRNTFGNFDSW